MNLDAFYYRFEDYFRGSRELIKERLRMYLPFIEYSKRLINIQKALDLGCGRGEWLELLKEASVTGYGIDLNAQMIRQCKKMGLEVIEAGAVNHLKSLSDDSLDIVTGFHIIEHLEFEDALTLFSHSLRVLKPGGLIIFETPNPENLTVGACSFYLDPTHRNPIPPAVLQFIAEYVGYDQVSIVRLQPNLIPDTPELRSEFGPHIDNMFFGATDYAVVACKPNEQVATAFGEAINELQAAAQQRVLQSYEARPSNHIFQTLTQTRQRMEDVQVQLSTIQEKVVRFEKDLGNSNAKIDALKREIVNIYTSRSWRLTLPLRKANYFLRQSKQKIRSLLSMICCFPRRALQRFLCVALIQLQARPIYKSKVSRMLARFPFMATRLRSFYHTNNFTQNFLREARLSHTIKSERFRRLLEQDLARRKNVY